MPLDTVRISFPVGVLVSIPSLRTRKPAPLFQGSNDSHGVEDGSAKTVKFDDHQYVTFPDEL
jgi:hypothetical protein